MNGFLKEFATPIIKACQSVCVSMALICAATCKVWKEGKKDSDRKDEQSFFSLPEYEKWKNRVKSKGWKTKYYKGSSKIRTLRILTPVCFER
eukprot:5705251-Amphidinium_carterae.1